MSSFGVAEACWIGTISLWCILQFLNADSGIYLLRHEVLEADTLIYAAKDECRRRVFAAGLALDLLIQH